MISALGLLFLLGNPAKEPFAEYRLTGPNISSGKAFLKRLPQPEGGLRTVVSLNFEGNGAKIESRSIGIYDPEGRQTELSLKQTVNGMVNLDLSAKIVDDVAHVTGQQRGRTLDEKFRLPENAKRENASTYWFSPTVPPKGTRTVSFNFGLGDLNWNLTQVTYVGTREVLWQDKKTEVYEVLSESKGESYRTLVLPGGTVFEMRTPQITLTLVKQHPG